MVASCTHPDWGPNLPLRLVPLLELNQRPFPLRNTQSTEPLRSESSVSFCDSLVSMFSFFKGKGGFFLGHCIYPLHTAVFRFRWGFTGFGGAGLDYSSEHFPSTCLTSVLIDDSRIGQSTQPLFESWDTCQAFKKELSWRAPFFLWISLCMNITIKTPLWQ